MRRRDGCARERLEFALLQDAVVVPTSGRRGLMRALDARHHRRRQVVCDLLEAVNGLIVFRKGMVGGVHLLELKLAQLGLVRLTEELSQS